MRATILYNICKYQKDLLACQTNAETFLVATKVWFLPLVCAQKSHCIQSAKTKTLIYGYFHD